MLFHLLQTHARFAQRLLLGAQLALEFAAQAPVVAVLKVTAGEQPHGAGRHAQNAAGQCQVLPVVGAGAVAGEAELKRGHEILVAGLDAEAAAGVTRHQAAHAGHGARRRHAVQVQGEGAHEASSARVPRM